MYQNLQQVKEIYDQKKELGSSCCSLDMPNTFIYSFILFFLHRTVNSLSRDHVSLVKPCVPSAWCKVFMFSKYSNEQILLN